MSQLRALLFSDIHYAGRAPVTWSSDTVHPWRGLKLIDQLLGELPCIRPDVIVVLGDFVNDGKAPGSEEDLAVVRDRLVSTGYRVLVVAGNHDEDAALVHGLFGTRPGPVDINGYRFLMIDDQYATDRTCTRSEAQLADIRRWSAESGGRHLVACQHYLLHPPVVEDFPYRITNAERVMELYREVGVLLSLSGHYHAGQPLHEYNGVHYLTARAFCEPPHPYYVLDFEDDQLSVACATLDTNANGS